MGTVSEEQTFFEKKAKVGQQVHEKMNSITNQVNANQNPKNISSHTCQYDYQKKDK